jgi:hypothetical protein
MQIALNNKNQKVKLYKAEVNMGGNSIKKDFKDFNKKILKLLKGKSLMMFFQIKFKKWIC